MFLITSPHSAYLFFSKSHFGDSGTNIEIIAQTAVKTSPKTYGTNQLLLLLSMNQSVPYIKIELSLLSQIVPTILLYFLGINSCIKQ
jgi:hypothetical protein